MNLMPLMFRSVLLVFALALVSPGYAKELVGKPVALSSAQSSTEEASSDRDSSKVEAADLPTPTESDEVSDDTDNQVPNRNTRQNSRKSHENFSRNSDENRFNPEILIPIVGIIFSVGGGIVFGIFFMLNKSREKERRQQQMNAMIDKFVSAGRDIPPELLRTEEPYIERDDFNLHKGIRNIGLGIGLLIFLTATAGFKVGAVGFILIGLGVSRVIIWKLSGKKVTLDKTQGY